MSVYPDEANGLDVCGALAHARVGVGPGCSKLGTLRQTLIPSAELFPQTRALSKLLVASSVLF